MANIMSQVKLRNKTSRNGFDLSRKNAFTAKVGELLPVACIECIPGDLVKGRIQHFTRTMPVSTAAYTRIREYYDWFFVPTNLLWNKFNTFVTQMTDNMQHAASNLQISQLSESHPYFTSDSLVTYIKNAKDSGYENQFGFLRSELTCKLLDYLGYGKYYDAQSDGYANPFNVNLNPFPLLAYQKIYSDYYRDSQWEKSYAPAFNVDYITDVPLMNISNLGLTNQNMFDLRYCNWNKDLFMGLQPSAQYGEAASIVSNPLFPLTVQRSTGEALVNTSFQPLGADGVLQSDGTYKVRFNNNSGYQAYLNLEKYSEQFSILALRNAEALQKWKEITQSQQQDYKAQIEAHFGVSVSDAYSERCKYIDGSVSNLDISEVVNQNITGDSPADIAGKGVGVGDGTFKFSSQVHGYLMCIYHAVPLLDYDISGIKKQNLKTLATDYAIPEFDATGMVQVPSVEFVYNKSLFGTNLNNKLLGYAPRYYDYKVAYDEVHGAFSKEYSTWVAPVDDEYYKAFLDDLDTGLYFGWQFKKVNPKVLDRIFAASADSSVDTDQLLVNANFEISAVRNLDRNGLPY